jgi:hypothetical protein
MRHGKVACRVLRLRTDALPERDGYDCGGSVTFREPRLSVASTMPRSVLYESEMDELLFEIARPPLKKRPVFDMRKPDWDRIRDFAEIEDVHFVRFTPTTFRC